MWGTEAERMAFAAVYPLFYGSSEERNYAKGIKTIKKLAENSYAPAFCALGIAYFDHMGVRRDYVESFNCYMSAAEQGYPSAECGIGNFYAIVHPKHNACENNPEKAVKWWLKASEHGNPGAQCNLAGYYLNGTGVNVNPVEAFIWGTMAVHCSTIRFRSAEVFRDQALELLNEAQVNEANSRIGVLKGNLPKAWSDHITYWRFLYQAWGQSFEEK
ncbi:tetratricopeptide repeat protein [Acidaminobacter sp.]|uniref:tetratricopeptide repeat protein n=1 Tax=Acidaminobacter sp. TaxID=1872102 RepID=UPI002560EF6E|nr:tetratricopeptide repeat protein [Acidaminobacter sp.]MDK9712118.1 sel1 repeat family protein [Acidaminobacter sp.]